MTGSARRPDIDTGDYAGYIAALEDRRRYFMAHGAVSADHSHVDARTDSLEPAEADADLRRGPRGRGHARARPPRFRRHMLFEMARMSCEDGLVMTLHPGVHRNHHSPTFERFGAGHRARHPDRASSSPMRSSRCWSASAPPPSFQLVLFTLDETVFSREIAPLAGFYPSVYAGAPWWFLDAPEAIRRFRGAVTETAGFCRTSGFIDDTRAFCSIPARHDMSRRLDGGFLARLVAEHRLDEDEALETAHDLVADQPDGGVQAVTETHRRRLRRLDRGRDGRPAAPGADRPPRARQLLPRPPGLVHRARPGRRRLGDRRLHRPPPAVARELAAQDGLYTLLVRAADGDRPEVVVGRLRACLGRARRTAPLLRRTRTSAWSRSPSPRPATGAAPTAAWIATTRRSSPTSPRCRSTAPTPTWSPPPASSLVGLAVRRAHGLPGRRRRALRQRPRQRRDGRPRGRRAGRGRRPRPRRLDRASTCRS